MTRSTSPSERDGGERPPETAETPTSGTSRPGRFRSPAFGVPAAPPGGDEDGAEPIRIVDPAGEAIAWVAPGLRAGCVGFAVRRPSANGEGWVHVFPQALPLERGEQPEGAWISPGLVVHEVRSDAGADYREVRERPLRWLFAERDPTAVVLVAEVEAGPGGAGGAPGKAGLRLRFSARLDDATLALAIAAANESDVPLAVGLELRFVLALALSTMPADVSRDGVSAANPGTIVARGRTPEGAVIAARAMEGVRFVGVAAPGGGGAAFLTVQGYGPSRGLEELPPGERRSVAASIGVLDG